MAIALRRRMNRRMAGFVRRRTPRHAPPLAISRRRLYILPTRGGVLFAALLLVMLLGATNYSNSLGFALTFWLAAIALVSMHHAHRNLLDLRLRQVHTEPVFADEQAIFEITLASTTRLPRRALHVRIDDSGDGAARVDRLDGRIPATARLAVTAERRGLLACPRLRIESMHPLGLFRAWSWLQPRASVLVYPRPAGATRLPEAAPGDSRQAARPVRGDEDFIGHRRYVPGDSPRQVDWKASARTDDLLVREHVDRAPRSLWLDYDHTPGADAETRLSQLTRWVLEADRAGLRYGLRLPDTRCAPAAGPAHRRTCLEALALV